jgi:hypothetical protein
VGPSGQAGIKGKRKCLVWFGFGPKEVMGRLEAKLGSARLCGQLGLRLSRPARAGGLSSSSWALLLLGPRLGWVAYSPSPPPPCWLDGFCSFPSR